MISLDFISKDKKFLSKNKIVKTDTKLGKGDQGVVFTIKGNKDLVVKRDLDPYDAVRDETIKQEYAFYKKNKLNNEKLFAPTKETHVNNNKTIGLVHPKLKIIVSGGSKLNHPSLLTKTTLDKLRNQITILTYKGYVFPDGYQLGEDRLKRIMEYDFGGMYRVNPKNISSINRAFSINNECWQDLSDEMDRNLGSIKRTASLDSVYFPKKENKVIPKNKPKVAAKPKTKPVIDKTTTKTIKVKKPIVKRKLNK